MKIIIIAGCQRSGTTMTGQILGAHSDTFMIDESDELYSWSVDQVLGNSVKDINEGQIKQAAEKYLDNRSQITKLSEIQNLTIVIKAPKITFDYQLIAKSDHDCFVVYPVRDVRSVVAAMLRRKKSQMVIKQSIVIAENPFFNKYYPGLVGLLNSKDTQLHIKAAIIWFCKTQLFKKFASHGLNPLVIKYEDVVLEFEKSCHLIAAHCDLDFQPSLMQHHLIMRGMGPGNTNRERKVDQMSLYKWKGELSEHQVADIVAIAEPIMNDLAYEL